MNDIDERLRAIWKRIDQVLASHAPEVAATLAPPATVDEIAEIEAGLGLQLPFELRSSLAVHNGQNDPSQCHAFCGTKVLMSTTDILRDWTMLTELAIDFDREQGTYFPGKNSLNDDWWRQSCIPFGHCEGYYSCIDVCTIGDLPAGRIVDHTHDNPMAETGITSLASWLEQVAIALEQGQFDRKSYGFFTVHVRRHQY